MQKAPQSQSIGHAVYDAMSRKNVQRSTENKIVASRRVANHPTRSQRFLPGGLGERQKINRSGSRPVTTGFEPGPGLFSDSPIILGPTERHLSDHYPNGQKAECNYRVHAFDRHGSVLMLEVKRSVREVAHNIHAHRLSVTGSMKYENKLVRPQRFADRRNPQRGCKPTECQSLTKRQWHRSLDSVARRFTWQA
jgi:hypothetical protein